jgi:purine-binding chemotaxis protein CheW
MTSPTAPSGLPGKYMTFQLAEEVFGLQILDVREIIGLLQITRVASAPDNIRGVVNLRGRVIPVVDLRVQFGMPSCETTEQTVIIIVQCQRSGQSLTLGLLVDRVLEVQSFPADQIEPPPDFGVAQAAGFIVGVGKASAGIVFLLGTEQILSPQDASAVSSAASRAA